MSWMRQREVDDQDIVGDLAPPTARKRRTVSGTISPAVARKLTAAVRITRILTLAVSIHRSATVNLATPVSYYR